MPVKALYDAKKARGECVECSNPAHPLGVYCTRCLWRVNKRTSEYYYRNQEREKQQAKDRRKWRKDNNRCQRCGAPLDQSDIEAGYTVGTCCSVCIAPSHLCIGD